MKFLSENRPNPLQLFLDPLLLSSDGEPNHLGERREGRSSGAESGKPGPAKRESVGANA